MFMYSAIQTVKYSLAAKLWKYPVLKNVVTKIWNSKKTYVGKLNNLENSSSASSSNARVTKKAVLKTAAEVETALKTKLVSERSMGNKENEPAPEKSPTTVTSNQQPKKRQAIPEEIIPTKKAKSVQSSLNSYFQRKSVWFFFVSLIFLLTWIFFFPGWPPRSKHRFLPSPFSLSDFLA